MNDNPLREIPIEIQNCQKLKVSTTKPINTNFLLETIGTWSEEYIHNHFAKRACQSGIIANFKLGWVSNEGKFGQLIR